MKNKEVITAFLNKHSELSYNCKSIALHTNINHSTIRVVCKRLWEDGKIRKVERGYYQSMKITISGNNNATYKEIKMHGIHLITDLVTSERVSLTFETLNKIENVPHKHTQNHSNVYHKMWRDRLTTFTLHKEASKLEIWLKCSNAPLSYYELDSFASFLEGLFPHIPLFSYLLIQIGINVDVRIFKIDSSKQASISFMAFKNAWFRIYEHSQGMLRIETHMNNKNLTFLEALKLLPKVVETVDNEYLQMTNK